MKIRYKDHEFEFDYYKDKVCLWTSDGSTSLAVIPYDEDTTFKFVMDSLNRYMNDYCDGILHCSDCGEHIDKPSGRYFAGVYCNKCWESKWKTIEAAENYE